MCNHTQSQKGKKKKKIVWNKGSAQFDQRNPCFISQSKVAIFLKAFGKMGNEGSWGNFALIF